MENLEFCTSAAFDDSHVALSPHLWSFLLQQTVARMMMHRVFAVVCARVL